MDIRMSHSSSNLWIIAIAGILIVAIVGVVAFILIDSLTAESNVPVINPQVENALIIDPPKPLSDFTLTDQNDNEVSLSDFRGKYVLLTFGYTHCPDFCPLTLSEFRGIQMDLADLAEEVVFLFISVDGTRDTPAVIQQYFEIRNLRTGFVGLTGDEELVQEIGSDYGLYFERNTENSGYSEYLVDHTIGSFLIDPDGNWIVRYRFGTPESQIADDIHEMLNS